MLPPSHFFDMHDCICGRSEQQHKPPQTMEGDVFFPSIFLYSRCHAYFVLCSSCLLCWCYYECESPLPGNSFAIKCTRCTHIHICVSVCMCSIFSLHHFVGEGFVQRLRFRLPSLGKPSANNPLELTPLEEKQTSTSLTWPYGV